MLNKVGVLLFEHAIALASLPVLARLAGEVGKIDAGTQIVRIKGLGLQVAGSCCR